MTLLRPGWSLFLPQPVADLVLGTDQESGTVVHRVLVAAAPPHNCSHAPCPTLAPLQFLLAAPDPAAAWLASLVMLQFHTGELELQQGWQIRTPAHLAQTPTLRGRNSILTMFECWANISKVLGKERF